MENQTVNESEINMHEEMRRAFALLSGKWKLEIMWLLHQRVHRFGELRKAGERARPRQLSGVSGPDDATSAMRKFGPCENRPTNEYRMPCRTTSLPSLRVLS